MARRKLEDRDTRTLSKMGNGSYFITIPIEHIRELGWQDPQKVTVMLDKKSKRLIVRDWKSPRQRRRK